MPEEGLEWGPISTLLPCHQDGIPLQDDSYDCKLIEAMEAHQQALTATHLLEEWIERLELIGYKDKAGQLPMLP